VIEECVTQIGDATSIDIRTRVSGRLEIKVKESKKIIDVNRRII